MTAERIAGPAVAVYVVEDRPQPVDAHQLLDDGVLAPRLRDQRIELAHARGIDGGHSREEQVEIVVLEPEADEEDVAHEELLERIDVSRVLNELFVVRARQSPRRVDVD